MSKRVLKITNALTGKDREITLPGKPVAKQQAGQDAESEGGNSGKNKR